MFNYDYYYDLNLKQVTSNIYTIVIHFIPLKNVQTIYQISGRIKMHHNLKFPKFKLVNIYYLISLYKYLFVYVIISTMLLYIFNVC